MIVADTSKYNVVSLNYFQQIIARHKEKGKIEDL